MLFTLFCTYEIFHNLKIKAYLASRPANTRGRLWPAEAPLAVLLPDPLVFKSYYISDILDCVLCFGGDILNITGNMLLAL